MSELNLPKEKIKTFKETDFYKKIQEVINELNNDGLLDRGIGYCLSMSDIVMKLLYKKGIESELIECTVMVKLKNPPALHLIGYDGLSHIEDFVNGVESHVVCVTKTPIPILIDASLKYVDKNIPCVCIPLVSLNSSNTKLAEHDFGTSVWTYERKCNSKFPYLHQESILKRINTDLKIKQELSFLKKIFIILLLITGANLIRGSYDFYQKYINQDNNFGPSKQLIQQ